MKLITEEALVKKIDSQNIKLCLALIALAGALTAGIIQYKQWGHIYSENGENLESGASTSMNTEEAQTMLDSLETIEQGNSYMQILLSDGSYNYALCNESNEMVLESDAGGVIIYRSDNKVIAAGEDSIQIEPEITPISLIKQIIEVADRHNNETNNEQVTECSITSSKIEDTEEDAIKYRAIVSGEENVREIYDVAGESSYTDSYINDLYSPIASEDGTEHSFDNIYVDIIVVDGELYQVGCGTGYTSSSSSDIDEQYSFIIESYYPVMKWSLPEEFYNNDTTNVEEWKSLMETFLTDISNKLSTNMKEQGLVTEEEVLAEADIDNGGTNIE